MFQQSERKSSSESSEELLSVKSTTSSLCKLIVQFSYDVMVLDSSAVSQSWCTIYWITSLFQKYSTHPIGSHEKI